MSNKTIIIGTSCYRSASEARRAYGDAFESAIAERRISIGKPVLKPGDKLLIDSNGRYKIEVVAPNPINLNTEE